MAPEWYPIDPTRDENGAFAALSHLGKPEKYRPNPQPRDANLGSEEFHDHSRSVSALGEFGVLGIVSASAAAKSRVIYRDVAAFDETELGDDSEWCIKTKWGVGYRLILTLSNQSLKFKADSQWAAIAGELGLEDVSFELKVFGFTNRSVLKYFPIPGRFDKEAFKSLEIAEGKLAKFIEKNKAELAKTAVPYQVHIKELPVPPPQIRRAQSRLFAMKYLSDRETLGVATIDANNKGLDTNVVKNVYDKYLLDGTSRNDGKAKADSWIEKAEVEAAEKAEVEAAKVTK